MDGSTRGLVGGSFSLEQLDHESLTSLLDASVEEDLNLFDVRRVLGSSECELALDWLERVSHQLSTMFQVLSQQRLFTRQLTDRNKERGTDDTVEVEHVEREEVDFDGDVFRLDVLPLPPAQFLEGKETLLIRAPSDRFGINDERLDTLPDTLLTHSSVRYRMRGMGTYLGQLLDDIGVLDTHILAVPREDLDRASLEVMDLRSLSVVLVLAGELLAFEPIEHFGDRLRGLGEHGLERDTCENG